MKNFRLNFIVEGQTEERFVNQVLKDYFATRSIYTAAHCITTRRNRRTPHIKYRGGLITYRHACDDIRRWTKEEKYENVRFTTMFDLYGLPNDFPGYEDADKESDPYLRTSILEKALGESINDRRFIPYIQLHEFEALLFSDIQKLSIQFPQYSERIRELSAVASKFNSPELINDGSTTAPSKRIIEAIPEYGVAKASAGPIATSQIGLCILESKCQHFREWLERLTTAFT